MLDILEAQQFTRLWLEETLFPLTETMKASPKTELSTHLAGKQMLTLFYEASTRTRLSFEAAMHILGGTVSSTENAKKFSSSVKGESLEDTIRVLSSFSPDVIVLRYHEEGGAARAAQVSSVPIINAGDGTGQHPTQALLDIFTIQEELGSIDGISIAFVGDLERGRTVHSLAYLLGKFEDIKIHFVSPRSLPIKPGIKDYLKRHNVHYWEHNDLREVAPEMNVIYMTRTQTERGSHEESEGTPSFCVIDQEVLNLMPSQAIIMHPLPRQKELPAFVDKDSRAAYFRQAKNGLYVRMALLEHMLIE